MLDTDGKIFVFKDMSSIGWLVPLGLPYIVLIVLELLTITKCQYKILAYSGVSKKTEKGTL